MQIIRDIGQSCMHVTPSFKAMTNIASKGAAGFVGPPTFAEMDELEEMYAVMGEVREMEKRSQRLEEELAQKRAINLSTTTVAAGAVAVDPTIPILMPPSQARQLEGGMDAG